MRLNRQVLLLLMSAALGAAAGGCVASRPKSQLAATGSESPAAVSSLPAPAGEDNQSLKADYVPAREDCGASQWLAPLAGEVQLASAQSGSGTSANGGDQIVLRQPPEVLPSVEDSAAAPSLPDALAIPIDFATALAIAAGDNPQVAYSRQRINEAFAQMQAAEVLWVPSLRAGMNYNKHEGTIQDVAGNIIETSRGSVYSGLGAQAVGAGSPAVPGVVMNFHTKDAIYQPRITQQLLAATRQANRATTNDILLQTALAYNDLLEAYESAAVADDTLANIQRLADVTADYARAGQGLPSDADRAQAELATRRVESERSVENVQVASVRLARLLSQDPTVHLLPQEAAIAPIDLAPMQCSLQDLVATSLSNRPELAESRFLVGAAVDRLRRERNAPLIPSVLLGLSYGGNGGGLGDDISNYGDRMDFDAVAYWEVRNLGYGEQAARNQARAAVEQARWKQVQVMDQVASDVAEAYAQVVSRREQIELARTGIAAARESYRLNSERTQEGVGLPIEALQAIQALDAAQRQYVRSVADYNRAQFRLQRALGWPVQ
jgi:outer membrane protein TolC